MGSGVLGLGLAMSGSREISSKVNLLLFKAEELETLAYDLAPALDPQDVSEVLMLAARLERFATNLTTQTQP